MRATEPLRMPLTCTSSLSAEAAGLRKRARARCCILLRERELLQPGDAPQQDRQRRAAP